MSHGSSISKVVAPHSTSYQGPFGRICGHLAPWVPTQKALAFLDQARFDALLPGEECIPMSEPDVDAWFLKFANENMVERPGVIPEDLLDEATVVELEEAFDTGERNQPKDTGIPAGYTYFGQFIDHDITFDPASSLVRQNDPNSLLNFRTPRLDLDNLYGRGPHDQPYLFEIDESQGDAAARERRGALSFSLGHVVGDDGTTLALEDLPRTPGGRAIIGDMRNDENAIVSQLQLAFLKAHNALITRAMATDSCTPFEDARRTLRWLYQWVVWHDFVARIAEPGVFAAALERMPADPADDAGQPGGVQWKLGLSHVYKWKHQPFMPVEFAVAAYRFGHSMVRNGYRTNILRGFRLGDQQALFDTAPGDGNDLTGFRPVIRHNVVQWDWFLSMESSFVAEGFPQRARKIDTKLSNALAHLAERPNMLAYRNLKRAWAFSLPAGTDVARKLTPGNVIALADGEPNSLWYYILKEAGLPTDQGGADGERLGQLGSTLVCAVFAGLLKGDPQAWLNQQPAWTPDADPLLQAPITVGGAERPLNMDSPGRWELASIIRLAGVPVDGDAVTGLDTPLAP